MTYICVFEFDGAEKTLTISDVCLADIKNGFWLNKSLQHTKLSDAKYWVPPSMLKLISKVES